MSALPIKRWTRNEYARLIDSDLLAPDARYELIEGQIVELMTHNPPHVTALRLVEAWLRSIVTPDRFVATQSPVALDDTSEPEPDIAVVRGRITDFGSRHPDSSEVELLVEVSDTSLDRDRKFKAPLYARAGIPELWILDLGARKLELYREPAKDGYRAVTILAETENAAPLFAPAFQVRISDLLPIQGV
jgi:Uma2 family endonuclease